MAYFYFPNPVYSIIFLLWYLMFAIFYCFWFLTNLSWFQIQTNLQPEPVRGRRRSRRDQPTRPGSGRRVRHPPQRGHLLRHLPPAVRSGPRSLRGQQLENQVHQCQTGLAVGGVGASKVGDWVGGGGYWAAATATTGAVVGKFVHFGHGVELRRLLSRKVCF